MGRRFQLFSPSPETNGSANSTPSAITGPISNAGVSIEGDTIYGNSGLAIDLNGDGRDDVVLGGTPASPARVLFAGSPAGFADAVVIGSALVERLAGAASAAEIAERITGFLAPIRATLDAG